MGTYGARDFAVSFQISCSRLIAISSRTNFFPRDREFFYFFSDFFFVVVQLGAIFSVAQRHWRARVARAGHLCKVFRDRRRRRKNFLKMHVFLKESAAPDLVPPCDQHAKI